MQNEYPLRWPTGWKRNPIAGRTRGRFKVDAIRNRRDLKSELARINASDVVFTSNMPVNRDGSFSLAKKNNVTDGGVAIYFKRKGKPIVLACDTYDDVQDNVRAITLTLSSLRAIDRYGASDMLDRAFDGFTALPAPGQHAERPWWKVLGFKGDDLDMETVDKRFRELAAKHHPDRGGDPATMAEINAARDEARKVLA